jgi:hypothetical protein
MPTEGDLHEVQSEHGRKMENLWELKESGFMGEEYADDIWTTRELEVQK